MTANWYRANQYTATDLTYTTVKNSHNFTIYILRKLCLIYFLQLSIACNITAPFSLHSYISRCKTLRGSHFGYVLCTSSLIGITLTKCKCKFRFCSARTNDIMQHFSDTNQQLRTTHVAYRYQSEPYNQTPHFAFIYFRKKNAAFSTNQSKSVFARNVPIKNILHKLYAVPMRICITRESYHQYP